MTMDKLKMHSVNKIEENIAAIGRLFPNCLTERMGENGEIETAIDFDALKQELSSAVVEGKTERYQFIWPDKRMAVLAANAPTASTLRPVVAESVGKDGTAGGFDSENLYIEGDNLDVLKLLQETYLGKIRLIYIDPPYNTGGDFVYNDDFEKESKAYLANSGQYDDQGNQLVQNTESNGRFHSDWLNMIYPRLRLSRDILTDDGAIFISIDDNECANLIKVCEEIFGESCFVGDISWQRTYSPRNDSQGIVREVEHLVVFSKQPNWNPNKLPRTEEMDAKYKNPDNDVTLWTSSDPCASEGASHQGMVYAIQHPFTGAMLYPSDKAHWRYQQDVMLRIMQGWCPYELKDLHDEEQRAKVCGISAEQVRPGVKGIVLSLSMEESRKLAQKVFDVGPWPKFYFTKGGLGGIRRKTYLEKVSGKLPTNLWPYEEVGHTDEAKKEVKALFGGTAPFDTPKPVRLLDRILTIAADKDSLVLDYFSGSATTAHAVMKKNMEDNGKRKFIMVQLPEKSNSPDYDNLCEIGEERIRRAGRKIKEENPLVTKDLDIGFRVLRLDSSNMKDVYYTPSDYTPDMFDMLTDNIKEDRTPEDLLFQVMLDRGIPLSSRIEKTTIAGKRVFNVENNFLMACFDTDLTDEVVTAIAKMKPYYFVMRDSSMANDSVAANFDQIFATYSPDTDRRVL